MTSSSDAVLRGGDATAATAMRLDDDLTVGRWTRLGGAAARGDRGAEQHLGGLADSVRAAARAEGYTAGWSQGQRTGLAKVLSAREADAATLATELAGHEASTKLALQSLAVAVERLEHRADSERRSMEDRLTDVVLDLVEAVIGSLLGDRRTAAATALARALASAPREGTLTVRLNPADHATLVGDADAPLGDLPDRVRLVADTAIASGDAEVVGDTTYVDATIAAAVARVRQVMSQ